MAGGHGVRPPGAGRLRRLRAPDHQAGAGEGRGLPAVRQQGQQGDQTASFLLFRIFNIRVK